MFKTPSNSMPRQQGSAPLREIYGLPAVSKRQIMIRTESIDVEQANHPRSEGLFTHSSPSVGTSPSSAITTNSICVCQAPPRIPRPRNAFILYRQYHQADVALQHPGLANPEISKIIGKMWREEAEETRTYWKNLAEKEKAGHQRQYPQYKYQPRRGGKRGLSARPASALDEDLGRCTKCKRRYITALSPSVTQFMTGGHEHPSGSPAMQANIASNPRLIPTMQHHHRPIMDVGPAQHGVDPVRATYYPEHQEKLRNIAENCDGVSHISKRRRVDDRARSPDHPLPTSQHPQGMQQSILPPVHFAVQNSGPRRTCSVSSSEYSGTPGSSIFDPRVLVSLPLPHVPTDPRGLQQDTTRMAPPLRPNKKFSNGPSPPAARHTSSKNSAYDESLTLAPLQIPMSLHKHLVKAATSIDFSH